MERNVGHRDRLQRFALSLLFMLLLATILRGNERWLALLGILPMITALTGYCHHYKVLGVDTRSDEEKTSSPGVLLSGFGRKA